MMYFASAVDQEEVHWIRVPTASAAEIPKTDGALLSVVYLQAEAKKWTKLQMLHYFNWFRHILKYLRTYDGILQHC